jgi:O-antigen/teichoic acid export membrane protein
MQKIQEYTIFGRQVIYVIAAGIATVVIGIIQIPIITRALGPSQYGAWTLIISANSLITPFAMLGFGLSIVRFMAAEKDTDKIREDFLSACTLVLASGFGFSLLFFLLSGFLATSVLKDASLSSYLRLSSILILLNSMFPILLAFFRRAGRIEIFSLLNLGLSALQVGLTILFLSLGYKLMGVIVAALLSAVTLDVIGTFMILRKIGLKRPKLSNMKTYLKWGLPLTPSTAIQWIISVSDRYIVNYFLGVATTGIYNAADVIGGYSSFALLPVGIVLFPIISRKYDEGNLDECRDYFKYSFKYLMMFTIPASVGLFLLAKPLLRILTTPEFISGSSVLGLAALGALLSCLSTITMYVIYLVGKTEIEVRLLTIAAALNFLLNIIFVPHIGIVGGELSSIIAYIVLGGLCLIISRKYLKFDLSLPFVIRYAISSGLMALFIWLINPHSIEMVFVSIIVGIITYIGVLILIRGFTKIELAFFIGFIHDGFKGILGR